MSEFQEEPPCRAASVPCDQVRGWIGSFPEEPAETLRITAGSYRNRPVCFMAYGMWTKSAEAERKAEPGSFVIAWAVVAFVLLLALCVGIGLFVYLAYRRGRWDRRLARRTALYLFSVTTLGWLLASDHPTGMEALGNIPKALKQGMIVGALCWLFYVALEPLGRRYWPHGVIGWTRLTSGRIRDRLVGRDILLGTLLAALLGILGTLTESYVPAWAGHPLPASLLAHAGNGLGVAGGRQALGKLLLAQVWMLPGAIMLFFLYLLPRTFIRSRTASLAVTYAGYTLVLAGGQLAIQGSSWETVLLRIVWGGILLSGMIRYGILTTIVALYARALLSNFPFTWDLSHWYAGTGMVGFVSVAVMAVFGAWAATAGQPIFRAEVRGAAGGPTSMT
jgi:serine/threonine-protein kinase